MSKTIDELREGFEEIPFIAKNLKERKFIFNKKVRCYTDLSGKMTSDANWLNGTWWMYQELNK